MERLYSGTFMSSLDMHGMSLTLMRVADDRLLDALDAPTQVCMPLPAPARSNGVLLFTWIDQGYPPAHPPRCSCPPRLPRPPSPQAPAWPGTRALYSPSKQPLPLPTGATDDPAVAAASTGASTVQGRRLQQCMAAACQALLAAKAELDDLDAKVGDVPAVPAVSAVLVLCLLQWHQSDLTLGQCATRLTWLPLCVQIGDGDCGSTLAQGAAAIHQQLAALPWDDPALAALALAGTLGRSMGGTSGAVVSLPFWLPPQATELSRQCAIALLPSAPPQCMQRLEHNVHRQAALSCDHVRLCPFVSAAVQNSADCHRRQSEASPAGAADAGERSSSTDRWRCSCQQVWRCAAGRPHHARCSHPSKPGEARP